MNKILLVSRSTKLRGGVTTFIELLLNHLSLLDHLSDKIIFFEEGKSPQKWRNIFLLLLFMKQYCSFIKIIENKKIKLVHLNPSLGRTPMWRDGIYLRLAKKKNIPVLFFIHGWDDEYFQKAIKSGIFSKFHQHTLKMADAIVVLSPEFKEKLIKLGMKEEKIHVLSTMVEAEKYKPEDKDFSPPYRLLFCARLVREKGVYEAVEAMKYIVKKYPDAILTVMGEGRECNALKSFAKDIGVRDNVIFTGFLSGKRKYEIFKNSHIFVYPSYKEGFPTVVLEAMAAGLPVITTPVGGVKYALKDGINGYFIKSMPPNPEEIAHLVIKLLSNPEIMRKMHENNMLEVKEKYDVLAVIRKIVKIYENIVEH